uniref:Uncharacterized protein n=1 Tax=Avena sativa TaxID=4498 RepID=A0ACD5VEF6_AVESA
MEGGEVGKRALECILMPAMFPDADDAPRTRPRLFDGERDEDPADAPAAAPTWTPPQVASSKDPDQALSYLHRACSLASLAVKHIDAAVAVISTFLDPKEVAEIAEMAEEDAYISEEGPYPSDD